MKVSDITAQTVANYCKLDFSSLEEVEKTELNTFLQVAIDFIESYTGLKVEEIDKHEDFTIVVLVLCEDMYDNRVFYVDKNNLNKLVETILGMHSKNLI